MLYEVEEDASDQRCVIRRALARVQDRRLLTTKETMDAEYQDQE